MVSIIICTYNREKFILNCLESLAVQSAYVSDFEIVIINNNSTDHTDTIVSRFIAQYPQLQIKYFLETRQGLSYARNRGIEESGGDYLSFIDDDAIATQDFVRQVQHFFEQHADAMAVGGRIIAKFEGDIPKWNNRFSHPFVTSAHDRGDRVFRYRGSDFPIGCNMSFRRTYFDRYPRFNVALGRIGKGGLAAEEKEIFSTMRKHHIPYYYDPSIIVYHQIDKARITPAYIKGLSMALGRSRWVMGRQSGVIKIAEYSLEMVIKLVGAFVVGTGYLFLGNRYVLPHLIHVRWNVMKGFLEEIFTQQKF